MKNHYQNLGAFVAVLLMVSYTDLTPVSILALSLTFSILEPI